MSIEEIAFKSLIVDIINFNCGRCNADLQLMSTETTDESYYCCKCGQVHHVTIRRDFDDDGYLTMFRSISVDRGGE